MAKIIKRDACGQAFVKLNIIHAPKQINRQANGTLRIKSKQVIKR